MNCTLCTSKLLEKVDDYFWECTHCGALVKDHGHYIPKEQEKDRYSEHNNDVDDINYQRFVAPITDHVLENFNATHLGLDYGCGTGPVISKMLKDQNFQVKLFDPFFFPNENYRDHTYDYIFSCEVFEHFHNPKNEIEKLLHLLKENGRLIIMTHLYDPSVKFQNWYYRNDPTHIFIYTTKTIDYISRKYHLNTIIETERLIVFEKTSKMSGT
ncbi:MAG: class I SAM-dependent methyltransferase [Cryomorphaceae bacterium]|nr:class I SAM-dependent methyltransferase [Cryomorphaceae bacterium]